MKTKADASLLLYVVGLTLAVAALYWTSLGNALVFDDERLRDGSIFGQYGHLGEFRARLLSYGSFVWVQELFGEGWGQAAWSTSRCTWHGLRRLLGCCSCCSSGRSSRQERALGGVRGLADACPADRRGAVRAEPGGGLRGGLPGAALDRHGGDVRRARLPGLRAGLITQRRAWIAVAFACYVLAVLSKEHAVTAIAWPFRCMSLCSGRMPRQILAVTGISLVILLAVGAVLYRSTAGSSAPSSTRPRAPTCLQLEQVSPGVSDRVYLLSKVNQATYSSSTDSSGSSRT
jgi:protein O-mannosyl-transferase